MIRMHRRGALFCVMLLVGCVRQPVRELPPASVAAAERSQAARLAVLDAHRQWSLQGRVALSNGSNGGSGRIDWQQDGARYVVSLSAPITRQSWRLSGDDTAATLEGMASGPRSGHDAQTLLREATGWVIPVQALSSWVRGAADGALAPAAMVYGPEGRLASLQQTGWTIAYSQWQSQPGLGIELPTRLDATRDNARVRLVIDHWREGIASP